MSTPTSTLPPFTENSTATMNVDDKQFSLQDLEHQDLPTLIRIAHHGLTSFMQWLESRLPPDFNRNRVEKSQEVDETRDVLVVQENVDMEELAGESEKDDAVYYDATDNQEWFEESLDRDCQLSDLDGLIDNEHESDSDFYAWHSNLHGGSSSDDLFVNRPISEASYCSVDASSALGCSRFRRCSSIRNYQIPEASIYFRSPLPSPIPNIINRTSPPYDQDHIVADVIRRAEKLAEELHYGYLAVPNPYALVQSQSTRPEVVDSICDLPSSFCDEPLHKVDAIPRTGMSPEISNGDVKQLVGDRQPDSTEDGADSGLLPTEWPAMHFTLLKRLSGGNGSSKLEIVRSTAPLNAHGHGLEPGSVWVLKSYIRPEYAVSYTVADDKEIRRSRKQFETELDAYKRITDAPERESMFGFEFILTAEATMTCWDWESFVLPLARRDLRDLLTSRELLSADIPRLMVQMAVGIHTLHQIGIIHSDIKPDNILLDFRGNVKLADFGYSYIAHESQPLLPEVGYSNECVGTLPYSAPEKEFASRSTYYGIEVDYWALGCVFYEMLTWEEMVNTGSSNIRFRHSSCRQEWLGLQDNGARLNFLFRCCKRPSMAARNLILGLLQIRPKYRYGYEQISIHPYFNRKIVNDRFSSEFFYVADIFHRKREEIPEMPDAVVGPDETGEYRAVYESTSWMNMRGACFREYS